MNRESGIFRNKFVFNDSRKNCILTYLANYSFNLVKIFVGKLWYNRIWLSQSSSGLPTMCNWFDEVAALCKLKDVDFVLQSH